MYTNYLYKTMDKETNNGSASMLPESENNPDDSVPLPGNAHVITISLTKTEVI